MIKQQDKKQENIILGFDSDLGEAPIMASIKIPCHKCGREVSISPSSQKLIDERDAKVICFRCMAEENKDNIEFRITREQASEVVEGMELIKKAKEDTSQIKKEMLNKIGAEGNIQLILDGKFTEEHLKKISVVLREIEMENPKEFYSMFVMDDGSRSAEEAEKFIKILMAETLERKFGKYKKVVINGQAYKVPTKDIVLKGISGWEVPSKYPKWSEKK